MDAGAHEQADDVVASLFEEQCCDGAIDTAAHGQDDARGHGNPRRQQFAYYKRIGAAKGDLRSAIVAEFVRIRFWPLREFGYKNRQERDQPATSARQPAGSASWDLVQTSTSLAFSATRATVNASSRIILPLPCA